MGENRTGVYAVIGLLCIGLAVFIILWAKGGGQMSNLAADLNQARQNVSQMESDLAARDAQIKDAQSALSDAKGKWEDARKELNKVKTALSNAESDVRSLTARADDSRADLKKRLMESEAKAKAEIGRLSSELEEIRKAVSADQAKSQIIRLEAELAAAKKLLAEREAEIKKASATTRDDDKKKNEELRSQLASTKEEIAKLAGVVAAAQSDYEQKIKALNAEWTSRLEAGSSGLVAALDKEKERVQKEWEAKLNASEQSSSAKLAQLEKEWAAKESDLLAKLTTSYERTGSEGAAFKTELSRLTEEQKQYIAKLESEWDKKETEWQKKFAAIEASANESDSLKAEIARLISDHQKELANLEADWSKRETEWQSKSSQLTPTTDADVDKLKKTIVELMEQHKQQLAKIEADWSNREAEWQKKSSQLSFTSKADVEKLNNEIIALKEKHVQEIGRMSEDMKNATTKQESAWNKRLQEAQIAAQEDSRKALAKRDTEWNEKLNAAIKSQRSDLDREKNRLLDDFSKMLSERESEWRSAAEEALRKWNDEKDNLVRASDFYQGIASRRSDMIHSLRNDVRNVSANLGEAAKKIRILEMATMKLTAANNAVTAELEAANKEKALLAGEVKKSADALILLSRGLPRLPAYDARIVTTSPENRLFSINLGGKQRMTPGIRFDVFAKQDGKPTYIGGLQTARVTPDMSYAVPVTDKVARKVCPVTGLFVNDDTAKFSPFAVGQKGEALPLVMAKAEATDPAGKFKVGDILINPFYNPDRPMRFFFAEGFDTRSAKKAVDRLGGILIGSLDANTDFLVMGDINEDSTDPVMQRVIQLRDNARKMGIPIVPVEMLCHYISE